MNTPAKPKQAPYDLVRESMATPYKRVTWYSQLSKDNLAYVKAVVDSMRAMPNSSTTLVARKLIEELSLTASVETVVRKLKELTKWTHL